MATRKSRTDGAAAPAAAKKQAKAKARPKAKSPGTAARTKREASPVAERPASPATS